MKKAISLIELIFTILIIGVVFTVIPKIVFALNKSDSFAIRQDAILNSISLAQMISKLPWDENSTTTNDILHVDSSGFTCSQSSTYRVGGFVGSRNCENNISVSNIGPEEASEEYYDDVDDWDSNDFNATFYNIRTAVKYCKDINISNPTIDLGDCGAPTGSTNLKRVDINTSYFGKRTQELGNELLRFSYTSTNIGQFYIRKRVWK